MYFAPGWFSGAYFQSQAPSPPQAPLSADYFDCTYFDPTYFDTPDCGGDTGRGGRIIQHQLDDADELLALI